MYFPQSLTISILQEHLQMERSSGLPSAPAEVSTKRRASEAGADDPYLPHQPAFKRIRLGSGGYCTSLEDGLEYNQLSPSAMTARHLIDQAKINHLQGSVAQLSEERTSLITELDQCRRKGSHKILAHKLLRSPVKSKAALRKRTNKVQKEVGKESLAEKLDRAGLYKRVLEERREKRLAEEAARAEIEKHRAEKEEARKAFDMELADLRRQNAELEMLVVRETIS